MYTSDKNEIIHYADGRLHDAFLFLAAGTACAVFGMIYEIFSHEVYSFYMIYAFLILLVPGALLNLVIARLAVKKEKQPRTRVEGVFFPGRFTRSAWNSALAALTVGAVFKGVLDIYGTTNRLIVVYPIAAVLLFCAAAISFSMSYAAVRKIRKNLIQNRQDGRINGRIDTADRFSDFGLDPGKPADTLAGLAGTEDHLSM